MLSVVKQEQLMVGRYPDMAAGPVVRHSERNGGMGGGCPSVTAGVKPAMEETWISTYPVG